MSATSPLVRIPRAIGAAWTAALRSFRGQGIARGSQIPITGTKFSTSQRERWDLEIGEIAVRDAEGSLDVARSLIEMMSWCKLVNDTCAYAARDVLRAKDGAQTGWAIADDLPDGTLIDADVKAILNDLLERKNSNGEFVIGGDKLANAIWRMVGYGDCFAEIVVERDGSDYSVTELLYLPTWQMFVQEDRHGRITGYQQRSRTALNSVIADWSDNPQKIVHWTYGIGTKYGKSAFLAGGVDAWRKLKKVEFDIEEAARAVGVSPNLHIMPPGKNDDYMAAYKRKYENSLREGIVTDLFLLSGAEVRKMAGVNSNLDALFKQYKELQYALIPAGFPTWLYPGLEVVRGARDISGEPAKAYDGVRASIAQKLTNGIRQVCDIELKLKLGLERFLEVGKYRILFPDFAEANQEDIQSTQDGEAGTDAPDDDADDEQRNTLRKRANR